MTTLPQSKSFPLAEDTIYHQTSTPTPSILRPRIFAALRAVAGSQYQAPPPAITMAMLTEFHFFSQLPSELRIAVWKHALPSPRIVSVRFSKPLDRYTTTEPPSPLINTTCESRTVFFETYTKLILSPTHESSVYIDFLHDTLCFNSLDCSPGGDLARDLSRSPHKDRIERCAIDVELWEVLRVFRPDILSEIQMMRGLKTIVLVLERDWERSRGQLENTRADGNTLSSEIENVYYTVNSLRAEFTSTDPGVWENGPPNVQLWLW